MKIYALGGLGSDVRIFNFLDLDYELIHLPWIPPQEKEPFNNYAKRLSECIDSTEEFSLLGVSFGGMMAVELNKFIKPYRTIIVSSSANKKELPGILRNIFVRMTSFLMPKNGFIPPPSRVAYWLFSLEETRHRLFLDDVLRTTDKKFTGWAVKAILSWENQAVPDNLIRIHGTNDRLLPKNKNIEYHLVEGGHGIIMQKADTISQIINNELNGQQT